MDRAIIDTILSNADLHTLVERSGCELHREGAEWRGPCPLHGGNNHSGFAIYRGRDGADRWTCFTGDCGSGDAISFVQKWQRMDFVKAIEWLSGGKVIDPAAAATMAAERARRIERELEETIAKAQTALADLRSAQRHLLYHDKLDEMQMRQLWKARGISDPMIDWWKLGYCPSFPVMTRDGELSTPTLTIPIYGKGWELLNIRHRLLKPCGNDKYRPERSGLGAAQPFMFDPDYGYDTDRILWIEGEIKAAVTGQTLDTPGFQVIGLPGKSNWRSQVEHAKGKINYICFDPGAETDARAFAQAIGKARMITLPDKIDDYINDYSLNKSWLTEQLRQARQN
jgi:hypothetical protein